MFNNLFIIINIHISNFFFAKKNIRVKLLFDFLKTKKLLKNTFVNTNQKKIHFYFKFYNVFQIIKTEFIKI